MSYLAAAERAGDWLVSAAERGPDGWCWPARPGVSAEVQPGVGWGTAGSVMFFVEAFRTTGDERWLAAAAEGRRWMAAHLGDCAEAWAGCGLFTGIGGWAVVLDELADAADDEAARQLAGRVLAEVAARASAGGGARVRHCALARPDRDLVGHDRSRVSHADAGRQVPGAVGAGAG